MSDEQNKTQDENGTGDQELETGTPTPEETVVKEVEVNVDYKDKWMRAQADYSNLVRETAEKRSEWAAMSEWQILEEFIPVYDNFKKAFSVKEQETWNKEQENWKKGI